MEYIVMIKRPWITPRSNLWSYLMMNTTTDDNNNIQEKRDDDDNTDVSFTRNLHSWECNPNRWICFCIHNAQNNSSNGISMIITMFFTRCHIVRTRTYANKYILLLQMMPGIILITSYRKSLMSFTHNKKKWCKKYHSSTKNGMYCPRN